MKNLLILACLSLTYLGTAQQTAFFETTLYVKDALGNVDSVVIGYDPDANYTYNEDFGEVNITTPFDTLLEVRAAHTGSQSILVLSKKLIGSSEPFPDVPCYASESLSIYVNAKHQPVTFYWDKNQIFNFAICHQGAFLTPSYLFRTLGDGWANIPEVRRACMTSQDSFQLYMTEDSLTFFEKTQQLEPGYIGNTNPVFSVFVQFSSSYGFSNCVPVGTDEPEIMVTGDNALLLYPNPAAAFLYIESLQEGIESIRVFDGTAKLLYEEKSNSLPVLTLDIQAYPPGIYFIETWHSDRMRHYTRFVKQ